jgi:hypothetical protein
MEKIHDLDPHDLVPAKKQEMKRNNGKRQRQPENSSAAAQNKQEVATCEDTLSWVPIYTLLRMGN